MRAHRSRWLALFASLGIAAVVALMAVGGAAGQQERGAKYSWDIVNVDFSTSPPTATPGGNASALADDGSKITITGGGTFRAFPGSPKEVAGGGNWTTFDRAGKQTATGTYRVTRFISWNRAPGTTPVNDRVANAADARAGLAVLRVAYSNGAYGVLTVSCHLNGTSDLVFEGITTTMGIVAFFNREKPPPPPGNANRTIFHVVP